MPRLKNLIGLQLGKLHVISRAPSVNNRIFWECICECGKHATVAARHLLSGAQKACGCSHRTHGMTHTREFTAWQAMNSRCYIPSAGNYERYGAKGITVCDRWRHSFENFYADMGTHPGKGYSLDRIDSSGNYEPANCRWATSLQQIANRRVTRLSIDTAQQIRAAKAAGERVVSIAERYGVTVSAIYKTLQNQHWA